MIINVLLLLLCGFLFSCTSSPIKYYPPKKNQSLGTKKDSSNSDSVTNANSNAHRTIVPEASARSAPSGSVILPSPAEHQDPAASTTVPQLPVPTSTSTVTAQQKSLLQAIKNPLASRNKVLQLIEAESSLEDLQKVLEQATSTSSAQVYKPILLAKAGELAQKSHHGDTALQYYRALVSQYPQSPQASKANAELALLQAAEEVNQKVIGAILPLTGKNANIGQHALNSIRIGLRLNKPDAQFRLAIFDSQGQAELAKAGVEKLIREDKVIAIIGGLSSKEALAAAQKSEVLGVPFIGLSQKAGLTTTGNYVFRNSLTAEMQVDRLVGYAFEKLGAKRFGVLYPNDAYGIEFANIYWDHVLARGGQITAAEMYDSKENDFTTVIQKMLGTYYPEARAEEYKQRLEEVNSDKKEKAEKNKNKVSRAHEVQENLLSPLVNFDVLFIPDTGKSLGQVIAFMKVNDVTQMTYLGTNIWNSPDLGKRASAQSNAIYFVDALDSADSSVRETPFFKDYVAAYTEEPTLIEMQVYESAKILWDLITRGSTTRDLLANNLRMLGRTDGVTGQLRMSSQRELERPLHILSLDAGQIKKIN